MYLLLLILISLCGLHSSLILPPVLEILNSTTEVEIHLEINTILEFDASEMLTIAGWAMVSWTDPRLRQWRVRPGENESMANSGYTAGSYAGQKEIWTPDIGFWHAVQMEEIDFRRKNVVSLKVRANGRVATWYQFRPTLPCHIDVRYFPFDRQTCVVEFGQVISDSNDYNINMINVTYGAERSRAVGDWKLLNINFKKKLVNAYNLTSNTFYVIDLLLQRRHVYYLHLVIIPAFLVSLLGVLTFFVREQGDRVAISIALVLTMTLYILIASQASPKCMSSASLLSLYLTYNIFVLILFALLGAINANNKNNESLQRRLDRIMMSVYSVLITASATVMMIYSINATYT